MNIHSRLLETSNQYQIGGSQICKLYKNGAISEISEQHESRLKLQEIIPINKWLAPGLHS